MCTSAVRPPSADTLRPVEWSCGHRGGTRYPACSRARSSGAVRGSSRPAPPQPARPLRARLGAVRSAGTLAAARRNPMRPPAAASTYAAMRLGRRARGRSSDVREGTGSPMPMRYHTVPGGSGSRRSPPAVGEEVAQPGSGRRAGRPTAQAVSCRRRGSPCDSGDSRARPPPSADRSAGADGTGPCPPTLAFS